MWKDLFVTCTIHTTKIVGTVGAAKDTGVGDTNMDPYSSAATASQNYASPLFFKNSVSTFLIPSPIRIPHRSSPDQYDAVITAW